MNHSKQLDRVLYALTVLCLAVALWVMVRTPAVPDVALTPAGLDAPTVAGRPTALLDPAVAATIIDASIFSDSRKPPAARYDPFEPEMASNTTVPVDMGASDEATDEAVPRLFGTMFGPDGPRALMHLDADLPEAQLYREGDRVGPYLVVKIDEQSVILDTSDGRIVLRLFRSEA